MSEKNPLKDFLSSLPSDEKNTYKEAEQISLARAAWELERDKDDASKRETLSQWLRWISVLWLVFSAIVIILYGCGVLRFGESAAVTFIAGSLLEVFALWKIALNYFFGKK